MPFALNFVHPLLMWVLLGLMLYSGYLGYKASLIRKVSAEERKAMVPLHYGQRHAQFGAVILGLTLLGAVGGMAATFLKNGKLILGPHLFVGLADLDGSARGSGLASEGEDIRSRILSFDALLAGVDAHGYCDMPLVTTALWLARHRDRLRA